MPEKDLNEMDGVPRDAKSFDDSDWLAFDGDDAFSDAELLDLDEEDIVDDDAMFDFDNFDDQNYDVKVRTAVLQKNDMVALLCIKTAAVGAAICRVDPREALPAVQIYEDSSAAVEWFTRSLRTSRSNGWNIVYDGLPLQG
jgi:hypothetical protein